MRCLAVEPLEDRTLPSAVSLLPHPFAFPAEAVQRLDAYLNTTTILSQDVGRVTAYELDFFTPLQDRFSGKDGDLVNQILAKLHYIDSHTQIRLADGVDLRTAIDAFSSDQKDLGHALNNTLKTIPTSVTVAELFANAIEVASDQPQSNDVDPATVPFSFVVEMARAAGQIASGNLTNLDLVRWSGDIASIGEMGDVSFIVPASGRLVIQLEANGSTTGSLTALDSAGSEVADAKGISTEFGYQLEFNVDAGQRYSLQASLGDSSGQFNLFLAYVFGDQKLDTVTATPPRGSEATVPSAALENALLISARAPESAPSPGMSLTVPPSAAFFSELGATLSAATTLTTAANGSGDESQGIPPQRNELAPEPDASPGLLPGGLDQILDQYRPKAPRKGSTGQTTNEAFLLYETNPDALDGGASPLRIDRLSPPLARMDTASQSQAATPERPIRECAGIDSTFMALNDPEPTEEESWDACVETEGADVLISETPDFTALASTVAAALLVQGGAVFALTRRQCKPSNSLQWGQRPS
jgi:hypothetical protein